MERDSDVDDDLLPPPTLLKDSAPAYAPAARACTVHPPPAPLPAGYALRYFAPFCYSPRGISAVAHQSRRLRSLVKQKNPGILSRCATLTACIRDSELAYQILDRNVLLVPVPTRVP